MALRRYRSVHRNNGKHLKSQMRGGTQQAAAAAVVQAAPAAAAVTVPVPAVTVPVPAVAQNDAVDPDKQFLDSLISLNIKYPKLYNVMAQFNIADTDGNGDINVVEFAKLMTCLGFTYSPDVIIQLFNIADVTGDGTIDLGEFLSFHKSMILFKQMDSDGSGSISQDEFITKIPNSNDKFTECDKSNDGQLNIVEFITCMLPKKAITAKGGRGSSRRHRYTNKLRKSRNSYH
jgi:Ca2+-binding EF-hand superfamily protein